VAEEASRTTPEWHDLTTDVAIEDDKLTKMRVAVIGVGRMGRRHIQAAQSLGLNVVGVCDVNEQALALTEEEQGIGRERHFSDVAAMFERTSPDCVIIATTAPTHCEYTCQAADTGVGHILCEKPMAVSLEQCDRMIEVCRRHGTALAINHQMRFMEQYTAPKAIIDSAAFGGLSTVTVVAGNFGLAMNGLHYFEMFRFMTGEKPRTVTAWFSAERLPNPRGPQFEDRAGSVRLVTAGGRRFYLESGADQGHGLQAIYSGPFGQLWVDELHGSMIVTVREEQYRGLPTTRYGMPAVRSSQTIAPADVIAPSAAVLRALLAKQDYPSGEDGRLAVAVLAAAYLSNESGNVAVDLERDDLAATREFPWA
jgi:predicted dehydrogenase